MVKSETKRMLSSYDKGGLVSKNAMSDYFLASAGQMSEMDFVGKHKMSTLEFENKFQADNNVDIAGTESLSQINTKPQGAKIVDINKPIPMAEGGSVDVVSGNEIPPGMGPQNVRDDIPANLSEGEYVVPADVVKYFGVGHFEKLRDKAKTAMADLDAGGRIGGSPSKGAQGLAVGGQPEPVSGFDPEAWRTVGAGGQGTGNLPGTASGSSAYEYRNYTGPAGDTQKILFVNGTARSAIPTGYLPEGEAQIIADGVATAPSSTDNGMNGSDYGENTHGAPETTYGGMGGFGNPLGELDYTDPDSVEEWASDRLEGNWDNQGAALAGGAVAGSIGAGVGKAVAALRDIAVVNAAASQAKTNNNLDLFNTLSKSADEKAKSIGILGFVPKSWYDGSTIATNKKAVVAPETAPLPDEWQGVDRTGGNDDLRGHDLGDYAPSSEDPYGDYSRDDWNKGGLVTRRK